MPSDAHSLLMEAQDFIHKKCGSSFKPEWTLLLGSGLENIVQEVKGAVAVPYSEIPGFSAAMVSGHHGKFVAGELFERRSAILSGRLHFYEGHPMEKIVFPIRLVSFLGCKKLILTAAVGAINKNFRPGDVVVVRDHINFMGENPLRGPRDPAFGARFPDLSACYSVARGKAALAIAKKAKIRAFPGVYAAVSGPSYETPAEVAAYVKLGGDVVGMSVVPEAVAAHQMGMEVLALCFVANMAAGISKVPLRHEDVLAAGRKASKNISLLIRGILRKD